MPSKNSKPGKSPRFQSQERVCSESELRDLVQELAPELRPQDRVLLEGPLGAGKSTLARFLLEALAIHQPSEGSPTFAIAHEYVGASGEVIHIDFYRLKSEAEIEDAGIPEYFWGRDAIVIAEWTSLFPEFRESLLQSDARNWLIELDFISEDSNRRRLRIQVPRIRS